MRPALRATLLLGLLLLVAGLAVACSGSSAEEGAPAPPPPNTPEVVPEDAIAVVAGVPIPRADFDRFFSQAEVAYEAQGRAFPAAGTPEYEQLRAEAVAFLVQRAELEQEAAKLGIEVTDEEVDQRLEELKQQYFEGDEEAYQEELTKQGLDEDNVKQDLRAQMISERLYDEVTKDVAVTEEEIQSYYDDNVAQFTVPETREVAHILVSEEQKAKDLKAEIDDGADFAKLAEENSEDPGSAADGGKLTARKGELVPEFEKEAFALETGAVSDPVQTTFGWHVIKALGDVEPESVTPFAEVEESIRSQLLEQKQNDAMNAWVEGIRADYAAQISYAIGFEPPASAAETGGGSTDEP